MNTFRNIDDGYKSWANRLADSKASLMLIAFAVGVFVGAVIVNPWLASMFGGG
jgi:hypothetical protein